MTTFATVLRSGGDFAPCHVRALADQVATHHPELRFVCLSDQPVDGVETLELPEDPPPGYWCKIELFRPDLFPIGEHVIYCDLDQVLVAPIQEIVDHGGRDVIALRGGRFDNLSSGLLSYRHPDLATVHEVYRQEPAGWRACMSGSFTGRRGRVGDQALIERHVGGGWVAAQDLQPGIYRHKVELTDRENLPDDASLIVFNGKPRPWHCSHGWLPDYEACA